MDNITQFLDYQWTKCNDLLTNYNETTNVCPPDYDGFYCWPATPSETLAQLPCSVCEQKTISRWCSANITTIISSDNQTVFGTWYPSNNTECSEINMIETNFLKNLASLPLSTLDGYLYWWHLKLYIIERLGYAVSAATLLIAISIFTLRPRLQSPRVKIHTHFFVSLALHAVTWLTQGIAYGHRIFFSIITEDNHSGNDALTPCRILMVMGNYFKLTSFSWILMESWYFYSFICRAPYKECTTIRPLIVSGWGLPILVMFPYVITYMLSTETNFCWVDVDVKINILAVPILLMILLNCCFFVLNVRVLFIKLNCSALHQRRKQFWKWFRSTLMLVPLFGTHDIFFCMTPWIEDKLLKIEFHYTMQIICSLQGFIVSILYCFINNEVRTEIRRVWTSWITEREIDCNFIQQKLNKRDLRNGLKSNSQSRENNLSGSTDYVLNTIV